MAIGLDIGTMNIVAATQNGNNIEISRIRDAFLDVPIKAKQMLKMSGVSFIEKEDTLFILGDVALEMANIFGREARRPISKGLVSPSEMDGIEILAHMIKSVVGDSKGKCFYSVPAPPLDAPSKDIIYHTQIFKKIVEDCGLIASPSNEAMAIVFAEASKENFSALSFSFGSGMTNVAVANYGIESMSFSIERGGDWIDSGAGTAIGATQARMCAIKESGLDLMNPKGREQEALGFYYRELIEYCLEWVAQEFRKRNLQNTLKRKIPIIISGGTSTAKSFLEFFSMVFERQRKRFPFEISEIRAASDPFNAVAKGLLIQALQEE
mgnify:CR=1 FL=1